jgi:cytochrome c-type biogenesis protein CcmH
VIFWLVAALMTGAALALVLTPLVRRQRQAPRRADFDLAIYRDQLRELDRDQARGLIGKGQGEAARLEIQRRMLAVSKTGSGDAPAAEIAHGGVRRWLLMAGLGAAIPALAVALYLNLGSPGTPGHPYSGMAVSADNANGAAGGNSADQSIEDAIASLALRLEQNPDNPQGWNLLGRSLIALDRHDEAVQALRRAAALSNGNPEALGAMAEAMVFAAEGVVTPDARTAFQTVLAARPDDTAALYYMGMALAQDGRAGEALGLWRKLAAQTPADAPWRADLISLMRRAAAETGVELGDIPSAPAEAETETEAEAFTQEIPSPGEAPGPSQEDIAAAADMSPEARMEMIRAMVERLASRLAEEPGDVAGWQRLANAYRVLGENAKAEAAERHIAELQDGAARPAEPAPGPNAEDIAAAGDMSAEERSQMIGAMVARLAERLAETPDDLPGWLRLGRSYSVLGRLGQARDAYAQAARLAPADTNVLGDYARAIMNAAGETAQFPPQAIAVYRKILQLDPARREALWFLGFAEAASSNADGARGFWNRLLALLPAGGADSEAVQQALEDLNN